jgi:hypothetical protein
VARILVGEEWYEGLSSDTFLEGEYERIVLSHAQLLFPDFIAVKFNRLVQHEDRIKRPDLALIARDYANWWVVEVELAHHPLGSHVLPQIAVFARASYGAEDASYLERQSAQLNPRLLRELMRGEQPRVLVIVNQSRPDWKLPLEAYDAMLTVGEVYRSDRQRYVIRLNGDYPRTISSDDFLTVCYFDPQVPRFLVVASPARLPMPDAGRLAIEFMGDLTEWIRMSRADRVWLSPVGGRNPLPGGLRYDLVRIEGHRLMFQQSGQREAG